MSRAAVEDVLAELRSRGGTVSNLAQRVGRSGAVVAAALHRLRCLKMATIFGSLPAGYMNRGTQAHWWSSTSRVKFPETMPQDQRLALLRIEIRERERETQALADVPEDVQPGGE